MQYHGADMPRNQAAVAPWQHLWNRRYLPTAWIVQCDIHAGCSNVGHGPYPELPSGFWRRPTPKFAGRYYDHTCRVASDGFVKDSLLRHAPRKSIPTL